MSTTAVQAPTTGDRGWRIGLWVVQLLLAAEFGMAGGMKAFTPWDQFLKMVQEHGGMAMPEALVRFIGYSEVLGALGMILPAALRVFPVLTAWAAVGLGTIMVLASALHASRGEFAMLPMTLGLLAMAAFVVWGRFKKAPIAPRG